MIEIVQKLENVLRLQQDFERALALQQVVHGFKGKQEDEADSYKVKNLEHMKIPLEQIKLATHDFHDDFKIGHGGYGKVYKADLFHFDVQKYFKDNIHQKASVTELLAYQRRKGTVAVKRLDRRYGQGNAEFLQEISVLPYFRHPNLVKLVGFCDENHERILVYEYASNGSLAEYISSTDNRNIYSWTQHLQICLDAARGLEFLHNGVGEHHRIIHRDIKSSNILLGQNMVGKISDFGLSRIGPANLQATFVMTQVAGTLEYVDPQYHKTGMLTKESDVYSFGVVLVEVLSGRLAYFQRSKDDPEYLPHMAKRCFEQRKLNILINPRLKKEFEKGSFTSDGKTIPDSISIFAAIAYKCVQENRDDRPAMSHVVEELEKALKSQVKGVEALRISLEAIRYATHNFRDILEQEGYGKILSGRLAIETLKVDQQQALRGDHEAGRVIFLSQLSAQSFEFQDECEWEQKLPEDYKKIFSMSKFPLAGTSRSKDLYSLLSSGILLQNEKLWFSIGMNGVKNEMVSARLFSFKNVKWRSIRKSRFSKAAKILDISNLNIQIQIKPQLLTPDNIYGAYLVFKFRNRRKIEEYEENYQLKDEKNVQRLLKPDLYIDCHEIIKRSEKNIQKAPKEELCLLLFNGILIDKGEKMFSLSKANGKKCHMLPAKAIICDTSHVKFYNIKPQAQSRYKFEDFCKEYACKRQSH
ncbi:hypothetical protein L1987_09439 [Smallanthus sonchifolius]|uniref:Uncharacterized protein n=1 Tax=Smallanthus sonchifolius TaxID=185202 RepID=A0ACB9JNF9_9ASTR|nr:hypothetical protein L1987_09439 [Smallanthus sonchifolius]